MLRLSFINIFWEKAFLNIKSCNHIENHLTKPELLSAGACLILSWLHLLFEWGFRVTLFFLLFLHYVGAENPDLQEWGKQLDVCYQIDLSLKTCPLVSHSLFGAIFLQQLFLPNGLLLILHSYCEV